MDFEKLGKTGKRFLSIFFVCDYPHVPIDGLKGQQAHSPFGALSPDCGYSFLFLSVFLTRITYAVLPTSARGRCRGRRCSRTVRPLGQIFRPNGTVGIDFVSVRVGKLLADGLGGPFLPNVRMNPTGARDTCGEQSCYEIEYPIAED